jgi:hypothetical protein
MSALIKLIEEIHDQRRIESAHTKAVRDILCQTSAREAAEIAAAIMANLYPPAKSIILSIEPNSLTEKAMWHLASVPILTKIAVATIIVAQIGNNEDDEDDDGDEDEEEEETEEEKAKRYAEYLAIETDWAAPIPF